MLICLIGAFSFLLVSEIPIFSFKFKNLGWKGNEIRFVFLIMSLAALLVLPLGLAMMSAILLYLISSILLAATKKKA
jgi:CDP-diacylglycerol--serine O-phosphatidyltransferase